MNFCAYIHFSGDCAEAMEFYADVFGAKLDFMMRYGDDPETLDRLGIESAERVMNASIRLGDHQLLASDWPAGLDRPQQSVSVVFVARSRAEAKAIFAALEDGAQEVMMPFADTFWADGFGMVRDRFGTAWMINGPQKM